MNIFRRIIKRIGRSVHTCQHLISTNVTGFQMVGWVRNIFYICLLILKRKGEGINLSSPIFLRITETVFDTFPYSTTVCKWKFQCFFGSMTVALPFSVPEPDMMGQEILWSVGRFGKCGNDFGSQIYINHSEQLVVFCVTWFGESEIVYIVFPRGVDSWFKAIGCWGFNNILVQFIPASGNTVVHGLLGSKTNCFELPLHLLLACFALVEMDAFWSLS